MIWMVRAMDKTRASKQPLNRPASFFPAFTRRTVFVFLFALYAAGTGAEKMYEYRDEDGVLHFTNIAPDTDQPVKVKQVRVSGLDQRVFLRNRGTDSEPIVTVYNGYGGPVEMEFALVEGENISARPELPARMVVPPSRETEALRLWPTQPGNSSSYQYTYRHVIGDPEADHHPTRPYAPPFRRGSTHAVSQAFHGTYSHRDIQSEYAVDIVMPVGTPVCAARPGIVMDVANDFFTGGTDREDYARRANFIRILHDDGTMALYAHLRVETIRVGVGARVSLGETMAESGDTGFSSGPHLHFAIQKNIGMELVSLPFKILNARGTGVTPAKGMLLTGH